MDIFQKIAYGVGIGIAISAFILFLYSFLPNIIENDQWERIEKTTVDADYMKNKMESHASFVAFKERYPDALGEFNKYSYGGASYQLAIANFTSNISMILDMDYNAQDDRINVNVSCQKFDSDLRGSSVYGVLALQYIRENTCMEKGITGPAIEAGTIHFDDEFRLD